MNDLLITKKEMERLEPLVDGHRYCTHTLNITKGNLIKGNVRLTWAEDAIQIEVSKEPVVPVKERIPVGRNGA